MWAHFTATNHLLGLRPEPAGLRIDPCLPAAWPGYTAVRRFRGKTLHIEIRNPESKNRGLCSLTINDVPIPGNLVPADLLTEDARIVAIL